MAAETGNSNMSILVVVLSSTGTVVLHTFLPYNLPVINFCYRYHNGPILMPQNTCNLSSSPFSLFQTKQWF